MSPKGGIRPHKKFSISSNRSEVLFVDYIAEHLNPKGRAGIIVPEGVIFQSGTAYKELAKKTDEILFVKIENDGYNLGAQRTVVKGGQLDEAVRIIHEFGAVETRHALSLQSTQTITQTNIAHLVPKTQIAQNGDWNLSGDRNKKGQDFSSIEYEIITIGEVFTTSSGGTPLKIHNEYYQNGTIPWLRSGEVAQGYINSAEIFITEEALKNSSAKIFPINTVLVAMYGATAGQVGILKFEAATNQAIYGILPNEKAIPEFIYLILNQSLFT